MNLLSKALQENHILNIGNRDPTSNGKVKTMMIFIFQTLESTKHTWLIDRFILEIQIFNMKGVEITSFQNKGMKCLGNNSRNFAPKSI